MPPIVASFVVIAFGQAALLYALRHAPEGYQNVDGFHRK